MTLGIGEPFTTTMGVALLFAFVLALPVLLYELYSFVLPAFSPRQQRAATPLVLAIPILFAVGVVFGYFVVLPSAVRFFQNFNSGQFNVLVQASQYYHFAAVTLLAMGLLFQVPVGILAATRAGIVSARQLRRNRRYALLACGAGRGLPAWRRHNAGARDGAAVSAVRGQPAAGEHRRAPRRAPRTSGSPTALSTP